MIERRHKLRLLVLPLSTWVLVLLQLLLQLPCIASAFSLRGSGVLPSSVRPLTSLSFPYSLGYGSPGTPALSSLGALGASNLLNSRGESNAGPPASEEALKRVEQLVKDNELFVFLKGTPEEPQCGFSRVLIQALKVYRETSLEGCTYTSGFMLQTNVSSSGRILHY